jgi:uncharacterized membrane protein
MSETNTDRLNFHIGLLWVIVLIITISWVISISILKSEVDTLRGQVLVVAQAVNRQTEINKKLLEVIELQQDELEKLSQH